MAWRAMVRLLLRMHGFEVRARHKPRQLRELVFQLAAAGPSIPRARVLFEVATRLGVTPEEVERNLYADVSAEQILKPTRQRITVAELVERYNLSLAQGLLLRAEDLRVTAEGNIKAVIRFAKLQRLLCQVDIPPGGGMRIVLSGPLSLFHRTTKYGRAMAAWLPVLVRTPKWRLRARCVIQGRRLTWNASYLDPIGTTHAPLRRFDSLLEERFFRDLQRAAPEELKVLREADPVQIGSRILCPDFTLVDQRRPGLRVPVEVVGFWTPDYLRAKREAIQSLPDKTRWLLCVDESLAATRDGALSLGCSGAHVFWFRKRIKVDDFLAFLRRTLPAAAPMSGMARPSSLP
jgi:predicted nuclease of restriction endonuclease-like RecB superfamily